MSAGQAAGENPARTEAWQPLTAARAAELWACLKKDERGLVCCVVSDEQDGALLMQAYQDAEAFAASLTTGRMHYRSRSRNCLWLKGETSGHYQHIRGLRVDCDADCLWYQVEPAGPACHTGERSCFFRDYSALC